MGGTAMRALPCGEDGTAESGAGSVLPLVVDRDFEGIDSERGIAWRAADSLALRSFLGVGVGEMPPGSLDYFAHPSQKRWKTCNPR